jgi:hypothetical protein
MATVVELGTEVWTTTAGSKTITATPTSNDLIVVVAGATSVSTPTISVSDNGTGGTYTRVATASGGGTGGVIEIWIRNGLVSSAVSTIYTATIGSDTGGGLVVFRVSGMTRTGLSAAKQVGQESTQTESPPTIVLGAAVLTANACIAAILGEDSPPALTAPTGWTESADIGYSTPTSGLWAGLRSSGETGSTISWTGGALTDHCEVFVELDITAPPVGTAFAMMME